MISNKNPKFLSKFLPLGNFNFTKKEYFIKFCFFWLLVALLELSQDYIGAIINDLSFVIEESLSYKLFWPLFIPFSVAFYYSFNKTDWVFVRLPYVAWSIILVTIFTALHLFLFSLILFGVSNIIHEDPIPLRSLLHEKLSSRLYIAFSIYFAISALLFLVKYRRENELIDQKIVSKTIKVKNGKNSIIVDVANIKWIGADGGYLDIYTTNQKHVIQDRLKNIIENLPENFKRIHKSTIANIDKIKALKSRGNGDYDVIIDDGKVLRLSRNYTKHLKGTLL
tara:strand:+ start:292 stop:1134 length:843 start_codon:yes stop_codon:yes gene_type:complete